MIGNVTYLERRQRRQPYGYYRTAEGREFLKFCYRRYLANLKTRSGDKLHSHGKAALAVAAKNASAQGKEDAKTIQALRRWSEDQDALWKDKEQNISALERLEEFLCMDSEIVELMEDRAISNARSNFMSALNLFFNVAASDHEAAVLRQKLSKYVGVFSIHAEYDDHHERYNPYFYSTDNYFRAELHSDFPVLSIQEFCIELRHKSQIITQRRAGFACVGESGDVYRFMISHIDPAARWIEFMKPRRRPENAVHLSSSDELYVVTTSPVDQLGKNLAEQTKSSMVKGFYPLTTERIMINRADAKTQEYVNYYISGIQWDVVL